MPGHILFVNPRAKKPRRTRRMSAKAKREFVERMARARGKKNPRRRAKSRRRITFKRSQPVMAKRRRRRRSHASAAPRRRRRRVHFSSNPRRRRRRSVRVGAVSHRRRRRRSHARRSRRSYRSNPRFSVRGAMHMVTPALIGGAGAVALDLAMGYASFIPADWKTGWKGTATKAAASVALGYAVGKIAGRNTGHLVTMGGLIVVAYQALAKGLSSAAPAAAATAATVSGLKDYTDYGMGAYMPGTVRLSGGRMGYVSPAPVLQPSMNGLAAYMQPSAESMGNWGDGM